jgi:hypothetical protein
MRLESLRAGFSHSEQMNWNENANIFRKVELMNSNESDLWAIFIDFEIKLVPRNLDDS